MTTPGTKTRALCVATRCTSVDQFIATFHRFCGDDQSFFVATMTSRPIGLETPFSIQLADKQPVLRGLCIVLDAWETPENRYKRPGIRLGIKRLTADSQLIFERLKAAARSPASMAEATPPPGPPPTVPLASLGTRAPAVAPHAAPPAPPVSVAAPAPPSPSAALAPAVPPSAAPPSSTPAGARRSSATPPPLPRLISPRRTGSPALVTPPPLPPVPSVESSAPAIELRPAVAEASTLEVHADTDESTPPPVEASPPAPATEPGDRPAPTPIAVTRFQVALHVATEPPSIDIEFRPRELPQRARFEPRILSDPEPEDTVEATSPAVIVDRPSEPPVRSVAGEIVARPEPEPAVEVRTPGSSLVLPANPLHDLSDESLEGFVDCTIYEESGNIFHPVAGDSDGSEDASEASLSSGLPRAAVRASTVPAMPFDTAPNLTVLSRGTSESLAVAPDEPPVESGRAQTQPGLAPPPLGAPSPAFASERSAVMPAVPVPHAYEPGSADPAQPAHLSQPAHPGHPGYPAAYPTVDPAVYPHYAAPHAVASSPVVALPPMVAPVAMPELDVARGEPAWPRWLIIGGTAIAAIIIAFVIAKLVRGSPRAGPPAAAVGQRTASPPPRAHPPQAPQPPAPAPAAASAAEASAADPPAPERAIATVDPIVDPTVDPPAPAAPTASTDSRGDAPSLDEDGEAAGTPVVGRGPCRLTLASTPAGSIVRLDDVAMGPSPLTIETTCEKHKIELSHARYERLTRWVTLAADKPQELDVTLQRPIHAVTVTSFPPGAEVSIDGRRAGTTPTVVQMMGFATVNLTFTKPGFQSVTKKVYSKLSQDRVFVKLMK